MPYVAAIDLITKIPTKDREELNPHIFALTTKMRVVRSFKDLENLSPETRALADMILEVANSYGYEGAFAGELNYSLHMILFDLIPDVRYWVTADITGSLELVIDLFKSNKLNKVEEIYDGCVTGDKIPFGTDSAFIDIVEWVFVHLCRNAAPDDTRRSMRFILGVLRHIDTELYRRLWALYEDLQIEKNGDVPGYETWRTKISGLIWKLREERTGLNS